MGMWGYFASIDTETQRKIEDDPSMMGDFLYPENEIDKLEHEMYVEKAWHGISYLLNENADGADDPLRMAILGGAPVGEDLGYGPARVLKAGQVKAVAAALEKLTGEQFRNAFNPAAMTEARIYPGNWDEGPEELNYLETYYQRLVLFYRGAAARGDGAVLWLA